MRSVAKKALALLLCITVALALLPATASLKSAQADTAASNDYLVFTSTEATSVTPRWTDTTTHVRYTTVDPATGTPTWTNAASGVRISFNGSIYFEGISEDKTLYTGNSSDNRWKFNDAIPITASGSPNALLKDAYGDPAWTGPLGAYTFSFMFHKCKSLSNTPALPALSLSYHCYEYMFYECNALTSASALPATTLAEGCYLWMFYGDYSLQDAPALPATTLANLCYGFMFHECYALTSAPALPAETLAQECYMNMFEACSSLTSTPNLPATTLAEECYRSMFLNCTSLASAPVLPAMTLAAHCYDGMFKGCTGMISPAVLSATTLVDSCYSNMFQDSGIKVSASQDATYGRPWAIPASGSATTADDWAASMLAGTAGPFTDDPVAGTTYYILGSDPTTRYLIFTSTGQASVTPKWTDTTTSIRYSTSDPSAGGSPTWTAATSGTAISFTGSIYFEGKSTDKSLYTPRRSNGGENAWSFVGTVAASGSPNALLKDDYGDNAWTGTLGDNAFTFMFYHCTSLTSAPALPATAFSGEAYRSMFEGCSSLTSAPALPATTLTSECYNTMFSGCSSLTSAPVLPATTLAQGCYVSMFKSCTALTSAPALPATTLTPFCYTNMFDSCSSLISAPDLPATSLSDSCYKSMFAGCSSLSNTPDLSAGALANSCYSSMFQSCSSLTSAPALPATTLTTDCYSNMFNSCTALTDPPALPATTLAARCYNAMFVYCSSLTSAPFLSAPTLAYACYFSMFERCTALTDPPALPATTLADHCYYSMFQDSGIKVSATEDATYSRAWRIPTTGSAEEADDWNKDMLSGSAGSFTADPGLNTTYYLLSSKARQPLPGFEGTLPTVQGSVAVITPTGSLAGAGYEVAPSDPAVAAVVDNEDGSYTVRVAGQPGDAYRISITANGNADYNVSPTYTSDPQTVRAASEGPGPGPGPNPPVPGDTPQIKLPQMTYDYTAKAIKPVPTVSYQGKALQSGKDYTLETSYLNNKELGKNIASATYTVTGLGENSFGTATQTLKFSIGLKTPQVKKVKRSKKALKVTLKSKVKGAKRYILYYSTKAKGGFKHKTLKAKGKTLTLKKKLGKKKYYVKVKAYAPKAYKTLAKTKTYKAAKSKKLKLKWSKSPYAGKYRIAYKLKGAKKWSYKSVKSSKASYSLKHLKKRKKYSVKIYYQSKAFKSVYSAVKKSK
jgi:hypothetical protein